MANDWSDTRDRLKDEGKWQAFVARREALRRFNPDMTQREVKEESLAWVDAIDWDPAVSPTEDIEREAKEAVDALTRKAKRGLGYSPKEEDIEYARQVKDKRTIGSAKRSIFEGRKCTAQQAVTYVAANIEITDPDPYEAPSSTAWSMLRWAKRSPQNETEFYKTFYAKLLPTRQQIDTEMSREDDGSVLTRMITRCRQYAQEDTD